ncbi:MAG TPA: hypothetical protein VJW76_05285 [Verrucomicrobiae bacterium]|nr:hypothetical protein [Verrucomicrobiae bacterium]
MFSELSLDRPWIDMRFWQIASAKRSIIFSRCWTDLQGGLRVCGLGDPTSPLSFFPVLVLIKLDRNRDLARLILILIAE